MLIELPAWRHDKTKLTGLKCYVNPEKVTGIMPIAINGQQMGAKGVPFAVEIGEALQIFLEGGGHVLVPMNADLHSLVRWDSPGFALPPDQLTHFAPSSLNDCRHHAEDHSADHKLAVE